MRESQRQTYGAGETINTETTLDEVIYEDGQAFFYTYDFGDNWEHEVAVEKIITPRTGVKGIKDPICVAGSRACPPEDCGGDYGYMELLEILKHPRSRAYREMKEWLGGTFDPKPFDKSEVNRELKGLKI